MNVENHLRRQLPQAAEVSGLALEHIWDNWLENKDETDSENLPTDLLKLGSYIGYFRQLGKPKIDVETGKLCIIFDFIVVKRSDNQPCTIDHVEFTVSHTGQGGFTMAAVELEDD